MSGARKSTLNPDALPFVPAAFQQVEDFSPEWWDLVKTSTWFRDHWFRQYQELEEEENDIMDLLPDTFDLDVADEFSGLASQFNEAAYHLPVKAEEDSDSSTLKNDKLKSGVEPDTTEALLKNLSLKSPPKNGVKSGMEQAKYSEKPAQSSVSPKSSPRRIIQQPR